MNKILVVDYNAGNVDSVIKALKIFNANVIFSKNLADLNNCSKIILPGQGTYDVAIKDLKENGFYEKIIHKKNKENIPILGICLGMQILSSFGYENNLKTSGLNLIAGKVIKLKTNPSKLPHIGWTNVKFVTTDKIFKDLGEEKDFYFIHSYKFLTLNKKNEIATSFYNENFSSIVKYENAYGVQFHPEKSLGNGLKLIENFLNLK